MARTATDRPTSTIPAAPVPARRADPRATRPGPGPAPRWTAALAFAWLALAYLGLALGTPHPDLRAPVGATTVQVEAGGRHLAPREGTRATVVAERPDPRTPAPPPVPALAPVGVAVLALRAARTAVAPPRGPPVATAAVRTAHRPRAPPAAAA